MIIYASSAAKNGVPSLPVSEVAEISLPFSASIPDKPGVRHVIGLEVKFCAGTGGPGNVTVSKNVVHTAIVKWRGLAGSAVTGRGSGVVHVSRVSGNNGACRRIVETLFADKSGFGTVVAQIQRRPAATGFITGFGPAVSGFPTEDSFVADSFFVGTVSEYEKVAGAKQRAVGPAGSVTIVAGETFAGGIGTNQNLDTGFVFGVVGAPGEGFINIFAAAVIIAEGSGNIGIDIRGTEVLVF